jgi:hypothetical protein
MATAPAAPRYRTLALAPALVALMIFATEGQPIVSWIAHMYTGGR